MLRSSLTIVFCIIAFSTFAQQSTSTAGEKSGAKIYVGVEAGFLSAKVGKMNKSYDGVIPSDFKTSKALFPGLVFHFAPVGKRVSFQIGVQAVKYNFESRRQYQEGATIDDHIKVSYTLMKIPFSVGGNFGNGKLRPIVRVGASINVMSNATSTRTRDYSYPPQPVYYTNSDPAFNMVKRPVTGILDGGAQYQSGRLLATLKARLEIGPAAFRENLVTQTQVNIPQRTVSAMLSVAYRVNK